MRAMEVAGMCIKYNERQEGQLICMGSIEMLYGTEKLQ